MKKSTIITVLIIVILLVVIVVALTTREKPKESRMDLGDIALQGMYEFGHFDQVWDLTACAMQISFTYDGNGLVDDEGAQAWSLFGVREVGYFDFNPIEGTGVWLAADYEWFANTFDPDPNSAPTLDIDDRLILQNALGKSEGSYDLPRLPSNDWANHAVWFDRDGVDQYQAELWGVVDGVTYNTKGRYEVVIDLQANRSSRGEAYLTINGEKQGFYEPAWHPGPPDHMPAGLSFSGDMKQLQVFYFLNGYGTNHSVSFNNISVTGCLAGDQ